MNCLSIYIKLVWVFLEFSNRADSASISTPVLSRKNVLKRVKAPFKRCFYDRSPLKWHLNET